jgi:hypothetical protein
MHRMAWIAAGSLLLVAMWIAGRFAYTQMFGVSEIAYRGETFQLSRKYVDYDDYKNDADNLAQSEIPRIEQLMTGIKIGPSFQSLDDFYKQFSAIKFPGYGAGPGPRIQVVGRAFQTRKLEIPRSGKARYFVVEKLDDGRVHLVDDFVELDNDPSVFAYGFIASMGLVAGTLIYKDRQSKVVRETPIR